MNLSRIYHLHEIGSKKNQEDYIWPLAGQATARDKVFIVCDGVGGSENGEVASRVIGSKVGEALTHGHSGEMSVSYLEQLIDQAREKLKIVAARDGLGTEMATTFCILFLEETRAFLGWCGDSRIYHLRDGKILYKTEDHSLVNSLVKSGEITEEEALTHPRKNIILKAVKLDDSPVEAEGHWIEDIQEGDYFLLCTDGLLENIGSKDLEYFLSDENEGKLNIIEEIQRRCLNNTRDNYSMYLVQVAFRPVLVAGRRKWFSFVVLLLLIATGIALAWLFWLSPSRGNSEAVAPAADTLTKPAAQDSLSDFEIVPVPGADSVSVPDTSTHKP